MDPGPDCGPDGPTCRLGPKDPIFQINEMLTSTLFFSAEKVINYEPRLVLGKFWAQLGPQVRLGPKGPEVFEML